MKRRWKWLRNIAIVALIAAGGWYYQFGREKPVSFITEAATVGTVQKTVEVTGSVEAAQLLSLRFKTGGRLEAVDVKVGDRVEAGQALASLDARQNATQIMQAEAALAGAQAELSQILAGPTAATAEISRTEVDQAELNINRAAMAMLNVKDTNEAKLLKAMQEVENARAGVQNAEIALANAQKSSGKTEEKADNTLSDKYENTKTVLNAAIDTLDHALSVADEIIGTDSAAQKERQISLGFKNQQAKITAKNAYRQSLTELEQLKTEVAGLVATATPAELDRLLALTESRLLDEKILLDTVDVVVDASNEGAYLSGTDLSTFKTQTKAEKTALNTEISTIRTTRQAVTSAELEVDTSEVTGTTATDTAQAALVEAQNKLKTAEIAYNALKVETEIAVIDSKQEIEAKKLLARQAENNLDKVLERPRGVDTAAARARVAQAAASLQEARQSYDDAFLTAPMSGIVTAVNFETGENISAVDELVTVMTDQLQIKANISESDIAAIAVGDVVEISFDALPGEAPLLGKVAAVDPAETVIQGVIYYQATISLESADERVKSGMTADLSILAERRDAVLTVNPTGVQYEGDQPFVYVITVDEKGSKQKTRRDITIGLEGDQSVEVMSGVAKGDLVMLFEETEEK